MDHKVARPCNPHEVVAAAQQLLRWYGMQSLMLFPYYFVQTPDEFTISIPGGRGTIAKQSGLHIESTLVSEDYEWFIDRLNLIKGL